VLTSRIVADPTSAPPAADGRPISVTIVVALAVLAGGYFIVDGALTLSDDTDKLVDGGIAIGLGVLALVIAAGAWRIKPWAWKLFMTIAVVSLTIQILRHFAFGDPRYARMALSAFIVFALTPRDVQVAFGIRPPPNADLTQRTRNPLDSH
jgi:hypothetical protein